MSDTIEKEQKATKIEVVSFVLNDNNELVSITVNANGTYTTLTA
jgi:archaellum component FlaF (FlaF/FlaG flagellin family)